MSPDDSGHRERAEGKAAWDRLPADERRTVFRLAREGRPHPDPKVAAVAVAWARWARHPPAVRQYGIVLAVLVAVAVAFPVVARLPGRSADDFDAVDVVLLLIVLLLVVVPFDVRRRLVARRVERANTPTTPHEPDHDGDGL